MTWLAGAFTWLLLVMLFEAIGRLGEMMLPDTNITMDEYAVMLERAPVGIHQLRRDMDIADFDLVEEWFAQLDWMMGKIDNAWKAADRAMRWRILRAMTRMLWPMVALILATKFPRLARWAR